MNIEKAAIKLQNLMNDYSDVEEKVKEIKVLESFGDQVIHDLTRSLHKTFVTPIDREDIMDLAGSLDDVIDAIDEAAQYCLQYSIETPTEYACKLASIIVESASKLEQAVGLLAMGKSQFNNILPITVEINRLEHEADRVTGEAMGHLFNNGNEVVEILKWRDIYNDMEQATDRAEDAANVLEGIVIKHS